MGMFLAMFVVGCGSGLIDRYGIDIRRMKTVKK